MTGQVVRVLGIDPGTIVTGYGIVDRQGSVVRYVTSGVVKPARGAAMADRLGQIHTEITAIVEEFHPRVLAIEEAFFGDNPKTAIKLGQARGVVLVVGSLAGLEIAEYSPRLVKQAIVGHGGATKDQVGYMVARILSLHEPPQPADATDALAVAICHVLKPIHIETEDAPLTRAQRQLREYGALLRLPPGGDGDDVGLTVP